MPAGHRGNPWPWTFLSGSNAFSMQSDSLPCLGPSHSSAFSCMFLLHIQCQSKPDKVSYNTTILSTSDSAGLLIGGSSLRPLFPRRLRGHQDGEQLRSHSQSAAGVRQRQRNQDGEQLCSHSQSAAGETKTKTPRWGSITLPLSECSRCETKTEKQNREQPQAHSQGAAGHLK